MSLLVAARKQKVSGIPLQRAQSSRDSRPPPSTLRKETQDRRAVINKTEQNSKNPNNSFLAEKQTCPPSSSSRRGADPARCGAHSLNLHLQLVPQFRKRGVRSNPDLLHSSRAANSRPSSDPQKAPPEFIFFAVKNCTVEKLKPRGKEIPPELKTGHVEKGRNSWGWLREALA